MGWAKYYEDNLEEVYGRTETLQLYIKANWIEDVNHKCVFQTADMGESVEKETVITGKLYKDRNIVCRECGRSIEFSANTQRYYDNRRWKEPKWCKRCRERRTMRYLMRPSF